MLVLTSDGPGTDVIALDGAQGLPTSPRGSACVAHMFQSGPTDQAYVAMSPAAFRKVAGEGSDSFLGNLVVKDAYHFASPPMVVARVTDGNGIKARQPLMTRNPSRSFQHIVGGTTPYNAGLVEAQNVGRWGGAKRILTGDLSLPSALSVSVSAAGPVATINTGKTMLANMYAGAVITFVGDTGYSYEVVSNSTSGILTIKGIFSDSLSAADGAGLINGRYTVSLNNSTALSAVVGPDAQAGATFNLRLDRRFTTTGEWEEVSFYTGLGLSANDSPRPWVEVITDGERDNYQGAVSSDYEGATVETQFPANFCEVPTDIDGGTVTFQWYRWTRTVTAGGTPYVDTVAAGSDVQPHIVILTFTGATTGSVAVQFPCDDTPQELDGSFTLGTPYSARVPQTISFTARAGSAAAQAGDVIKIHVNPLPANLSSLDAYLFPFAVSSDGASQVALRIISNDYRSVTVRSDDLAGTYTSMAAMGRAQLVGTADLTGITLSSGSTFIFTLDGRSTTLTTTAGQTGVANIASHLNSLDLLDFLVFDEDPDQAGHLRVRSNVSVGPLAVLTIGNGTGNTALGFTNGQTDSGSAGVPCRISGRFPMWGGYDGVTPSAARFQAAFDLSTHIFQDALRANLGLVRVALPDVYDQATHAAVEAFCRQNGWLQLADFDPSLYSSSTPSEAAVAHLDADAFESDYVERYFPSAGMFLNTDKTALVQRSMAGAMLGLRARLAIQGTAGQKGFHLAMANSGEQGLLSPLVRALPSSLGRWTPRLQLLDDAGIVAIQWEGAKVFPWGNRMRSLGRTPDGRRYTITERAVVYHVARTLFIVTRPLIFKPISQRDLSKIRADVRDQLVPLWQDGEFSDLKGPGFDQQVAVELPPALNTTDLLNAGQVTIQIQFVPRAALEKLRIIITPTQLTVG